MEFIWKNFIKAFVPVSMATPTPWTQTQSPFFCCVETVAASQIRPTPAAAFYQSQRQLLPGAPCHDGMQFSNLIAQDNLKVFSQVGSHLRNVLRWPLRPVLWTLLSPAVRAKLSVLKSRGAMVVTFTSHLAICVVKKGRRRECLMLLWCQVAGGKWSYQTSSAAQRIFKVYLSILSFFFKWAVLQCNHQFSFWYLWTVLTKLK